MAKQKKRKATSTPKATPEAAPSSPVVRSGADTSIEADGPAVEADAKQVAIQHPPFADEQVLTQPKNLGLTPEQEDALGELRATVNTIANGEDASLISWRFMTKTGRPSGTNLQYYFDCKKNEIINGVPCAFSDPIGAPTAHVASKALAAPTKQSTLGKKCKGCS